MLEHKPREIIYETYDERPGEAGKFERAIQQRDIIPDCPSVIIDRMVRSKIEDIDALNLL